MIELSKEEIKPIVNLLKEKLPEIEKGNWEEDFHELDDKVLYHNWSPRFPIWLREFLEDVGVDVLAESHCVPPHYYQNMSLGQNQIYTVPSCVTNICRCAYLRSFIKKLYIGSNVSNISDYAFSSCPDLELVTIEDGAQPISIGDKAFLSCVRLKNVIIKKPVQHLGEQAFSTDEKRPNLGSLEYVYIKKILPSASIGFRAFQCANLKFVEYGGTMKEFNDLLLRDKGAIASDQLQVVIKCSDGEFDYFSP